MKSSSATSCRCPIIWKVADKRVFASWESGEQGPQRPRSDSAGFRSTRRHPSEGARETIFDMLYSKKSRYFLFVEEGYTGAN